MKQSSFLSNSRYLLMILLILGLSLDTLAKDYQLYVGMSTMLSCPNPPTGAVYQTSWASKHKSLQVVKDGTYGAKVTCTSYFSGTAQVQCDYYWRWYVGNRQYTNHATTYFNFTCKPVNIRMNQTDPIKLSSGSGCPLSVTLSPSISPSPTVYWQSSNSNIAEIGQNGYVTGRQPGTATISASTNAGPDKATIQVIVEAVSATGASISPTIENIVIGESKQLKLNITPQYAQARFTDWKSENTTIVSVSQTGTITGKAEGSTYVYCVVDGYITTNKVRVNVTKPKLTLSVDKGSGLYEAGTQVFLTTNKSGSEIYYTLDGSTPSKTSVKYNAPITLMKSCTLKAIAYRNDCLDSEVLSVDYKISSLKAEETYPEAGETVIRKYLAPSIKYNFNIRLKDPDCAASLRLKGGKEIKGKLIAKNALLSFVPENELSEGEYTLTIPAECILSDNGEENFKYEFCFTVKGSDKIIDVSAGNQFVQILKGDNTLWAWGRNDSGQIGDGSTNYVSSPTKILDDIVTIEAGSGGAAAIGNNGNLYRWGANDYGQIGNGTVKDVKSPISILSNSQKVSFYDFHTIGITEGGYLYSWGHNSYGDLGIGTTSLYEWKPRFVMSNVKDATAGYYTSFIITNDNKLYACGSNYSGELGLSSFYSKMTKPTLIMEDVKKVASMSSTTVVLRKDGSVCTFGSNKYGELGIGEEIEKSHGTICKILSDVKDIDAQEHSAIAIKNDGSLWFWGANFQGEGGTGNKEIQWKPVKIMDGVEKAAVSYYNALALTKDGKLHGWGNNWCSQLGTREIGINDEILTPNHVIPYFETGANPESVELEEFDMNVGEEVVVLPCVTPANADCLTLKWWSSDEKVATVSQFGVVTALNPGKVTIYYGLSMDSDIKGECTVNILEASSPHKNFYLMGSMNNWEFHDCNYQITFKKDYGPYMEYSSTFIFPYSPYGSNEFVIMSENEWYHVSDANEGMIFAGVDKETTSKKIESSHILRQDYWYNTFILPMEFSNTKIDVLLRYYPYDDHIEATFTWDPTTGINDIRIDNNEEAVYYNLQGIKVDKSKKGVLIKKIKGKSIKVLR